MPSSPFTRTALNLAAIAAAGALALTACGTGGDTAATSAPTEATSSAPATTDAPATTASLPTETKTDSPTHSDESLATILKSVKVGDKAVEPMPMAQVRPGLKAAMPTVTPKACEFAATGVSPLVAGGAPASMAMTSTGLTIAVVDAGTEAEAKEYAKNRDGLLTDPQCKAVKVVAGETSVEVKISGKDIDIADVDDEKVIETDGTSASGPTKAASVLSTKGRMIILVTNNASTDTTQVKAVITDIAGKL
ncbi:hypothetical protein ACQB6R_06800 [Propionibacteriaceae bacterium G1746]